MNHKEELVMTEINFVEVTWERALRVWWSLICRGLFFGFLAIATVGLILGFILELVRLESEIIRVSCLIAGYLICVPVGIAVTKSILNKHYSDFKIALISR